MKSETQMLSAELETHRFELEMSINELQVTNQALKEREEYLSNMIEHASEGIMIVNQSGLINSANHVVCNLLDIENHQLINKPLNLFINKAVKKEINAFFVLSEHNEHFKTKANLKQWNKKESIPVQISISALKHFFDKKFLVILTDLSQIVKIKEDLAQEKAEKESLLEVNKNLDKFVYHVSHDLRAPVASSLGLIELTRLEGDKSKISEYLDLQKKNLLRLDAFISNILKYSRNTRLAVKQDNITFQKLFDSLMNQHKYFEDALKVNFKVDINQEEVFINDEMRLDIILSNLISNAIKYSDPVKEENRITLEINANKNLAEIKITDNGIGIEEEYIERIFDPFFRATDYKHGSGIGLALVKEAVDKINGSILVCSKFKEGTTFTVSIPALK